MGQTRALQSPHWHNNKDSMNYQQRKHHGYDNKTGCNRPTLHDISQGILNGSIPTAVSDTAATSTTFLPSALKLLTGTVSTAVFHLPNGASAAATMIHKLHHNLQEPACSVKIVLSLVGNSLLSTDKMVKAGYTAIYDDKEVNFYNTATTQITVSADAIFKGGAMPMGQTVACPPLLTPSAMKTQTPSSLIICTIMTV
jgi:hypothetical protein